MLLRVVEGYALLQVGSGSGQFTLPKYGLAHGPMRLQKGGRVLLALGETEELLGEFARRLQLPARLIKQPEAPEHWEELRGLPDLPAERSCPGVDTLDFRRSKALDGHQRATEGGLQGEFVLRTLGGVREGREQLQPLAEVADGFHVGRALDGALAGPLPIGNGLRRHTGLRIVDGNASYARTRGVFKAQPGDLKQILWAKVADPSKSSPGSDALVDNTAGGYCSAARIDTRRPG